MKTNELRALIQECYKEVLAEGYGGELDPEVKKIESAIKSGKIDIKAIEAATKEAEKGNTTALAMLMAGIGPMFENEEMDLPSDTGKNINMGFDNNIGLDVDKRMSKNMSEVMSKIEKLKAQLKPSIEAFNSKKITRQQYDEATTGLRASIAAAKAELEKMIAKL